MASPRGSEAAIASMRGKRTTADGGASGEAPGTALHSYKDDDPAFKISRNGFLVSIIIGFVAFGAILHVTGEPVNRKPPSPPSTLAGPSPGYDYFKLALQWPNSYCRRDQHNLCNPLVPPQQFTIHGLWPQKGGGTPQPTCCSTQDQPTEADLTSSKANLLSYWPRLQSTDDWDKSKILWYAQWRTYGSCSSNKINPKDYFKKATDLAAKHSQNILTEMKAQGIEPNGKSYSASKILAPIQKATGFKADIKCSKDNSGAIQLLEIHLCVKDDGVALQNCLGKIIGCESKDPIFPSAPSPPPPSPPPPPPSARTPGFDYFLLTLQWPNALCKEAYITCKPSVPAQYFTIHGLWPQRINQQIPNKCDTNEIMTDPILEEFQCELLEYWPRLYSADDFDKSKKFWIEEWDKHGTCSSNKFSPEAYLRATIELGRNHGPLILSTLEQQGIKPDGTTLYTANSVLAAIKKATNTKVLIRCSTDKSSKLQLYDIRICVKDDGTTLIDCPRGDPVGNCAKNFIFPSPPTTTHTLLPSYVSSTLQVEEAVGL